MTAHKPTGGLHSHAGICLLSSVTLAVYEPWIGVRGGEGWLSNRKHTQECHSGLRAGISEIPHQALDDILHPVQPRPPVPSS